MVYWNSVLSRLEFTNPDDKSVGGKWKSSFLHFLIFESSIQTKTNVQSSNGSAVEVQIPNSGDPSPDFHWLPVSRIGNPNIGQNDCSDSLMWVSPVTALTSATKHLTSNDWLSTRLHSLVIL